MSIHGDLVNNVELILLVSKARTATEQSDDQTNMRSNKGAILFINVSDMTGGAPVLTPKLQAKDPATGNYINIWTVAVPIIAVGKYTYEFGLGGAGSAGEYLEAVNLLIGKTFRLEMGHAGGGSATSSAAITLIS